MRNILKVFRFEFLTVLKRRSFILSLILVPLIPALLIGVLKLINQDESQTVQQLIVQEVANPLPIGVVDHSSLIRDYPDWLTGGRLLPLDSEAAASEKTAAGELQGYYVINADYLESGNMRFVKPQINMITELVQQDALKDLINYNLLGGNPERFTRFMNPTTFSFEYLNPKTADTRDQSNAATYWVPYAVTMFFYMFILISSSLMLNAVTKDKENKTIEILLSSAKPLDLFVGKILALGSLSLLQMLVWAGTLASFTGQAKDMLPFLQNVHIPTGVLAASAPYFIAGFLLYGSLMAGMGAMTPNLREGNQSTFVLSLPLIFSVMSIAQLIENPYSAFTTFMTLFPFTSPVVMLTRLAVGPVPAWQLVVSSALLIAAVVLIVRGVANLFSSQYLLSGQKFNLGLFFRTVLIGHRRS